MPTVLYNTELAPKKRVRFTGDDALKAGYALCYDRDNITATNAAGTTLTAAYSSFARHAYVEKPAAGNLDAFAGIVCESKPAVTGGQEVTIFLPTPGLVREVYSDVSATAMTTSVTLQAGSYAFGGDGDGVIVGKYLQTKDRSSANGLIQAVITGIDPLLALGQTPSSTVRTCSPAIWNTCPWSAIEQGIVSGRVLFEDFEGGYALIAAQAATALGGKYNLYGISDGTGGSIITTLTDEPGGVLSLQTTTNDENCAITLPGGNLAGMFQCTTSNGLWFEARVKIGPDTAGKDDACVYIGLGEEALLGNGTILTTSDALADKDYIGWIHQIADEKWDCVWNTDTGGASPVTLSADAHTSVVDTYVNLGFVSDGTSIQAYVNGVASGDPDLLSAPDFPLDEEMNIYFDLMSSGGESSVAEIDWVKCACTI